MIEVAFENLDTGTKCESSASLALFNLRKLFSNELRGLCTWPRHVLIQYCEAYKAFESRSLDDIRNDLKYEILRVLDYSHSYLPLLFTLLTLLVRLECSETVKRFIIKNLGTFYHEAQWHYFVLKQYNLFQDDLMEQTQIVLDSYIALQDVIVKDTTALEQYERESKILVEKLRNTEKYYEFKKEMTLQVYLFKALHLLERDATSAKLFLQLASLDTAKSEFEPLAEWSACRLSIASHNMLRFDSTLSFDLMHSLTVPYQLDWQHDKIFVTRNVALLQRIIPVLFWHIGQSYIDSWLEDLFDTLSWSSSLISLTSIKSFLVATCLSVQWTHPKLSLSLRLCRWQPPIECQIFWNSCLSRWSCHPVSTSLRANHQIVSKIQCHLRDQELSKVLKQLYLKWNNSACATACIQNTVSLGEVNLICCVPTSKDSV